MQHVPDGKSGALYKGGSRHGGFARTLKFKTVNGAAAAGHDQSVSGLQYFTGFAAGVNRRGIADFDGLALEDSRCERKRIEGTNAAGYDLGRKRPVNRI